INWLGRLFLKLSADDTIVFSRKNWAVISTPFLTMYCLRQPLSIKNTFCAVLFCSNNFVLGATVSRSKYGDNFSNIFWYLSIFVTYSVKLLLKFARLGCPGFFLYFYL